MRQRCYRELIHLDNIKDRFDYLKLTGEVGADTFGSHRFLNQRFYSSKQWRDVRKHIILRDSSCDLGILDYEIYGRPVIHHINPITVEDLENENWEKLLDPENLITTSYDTHNAIHYGNSSMLPRLPIERKPGDTCPWK
jgi:hypothetical protein